MFAKKLFAFTALTFGILMGGLLVNPSEASASIGTIEMRSTTSEDYRCYAHSLLTPGNRYDVAINCVNLVFPIDPPNISTYVLWATPTAGRNKNQPIRLGDLGRGIARFETVDTFTELYVTVENNGNVRTPSSRVVMRGSVESIRFLERPTTPTPTPEVDEADGDEKPTTDTTKLTTRQKLLLALKRAGIAAVIALVAIVGLIFVVTRSRG